MTNIDHAIRDALSKEDAEFLARFQDEKPIYEEVFGTFVGRNGILNMFAAAITFALFGAAVYCAWNLFAVTGVRESILWSLGVAIAMLAVAMLKMYFWMELNKNAVLREVKRLELQVARLASRDAA